MDDATLGRWLQQEFPYILKEFHRQAWPLKIGYDISATFTALTALVTLLREAEAETGDYDENGYLPHAAKVRARLRAVLPK